MSVRSNNLVESDLEKVPDLELYTVRTPEMVEFSFPLAGPGSRFLAWLIDLIVIGAIAAALFALVLIFGCSIALLTRSGSSFSAFLAVFYVAFFLLKTFYSVYFEMRWNGQTPGKRALGVRVISEGGMRLSLTQSMIRNLSRFLDCLPGFAYTLGLTSMAVTEHCQRIGDVLAGTVVVRVTKRPLPDELKLPQAKYNTLLNDPTLAMRVGRVLKPEERELLVEVVQRRDELSLDARSKLFEVLATHFRDRLGSNNREHHLSDEKWILNLTQTLLLGEQKALKA